MNEKQFVDSVQALLEEFIMNDKPLSKEEAGKMADRFFSLGQLSKGEPIRSYHQTVRIHREGGEWVPVTVFFETDEQGQIDSLRIHSRYFIEEFRK